MSEINSIYSCLRFAAPFMFMEKRSLQGLCNQGKQYDSEPGSVVKKD